MPLYEFQCTACGIRDDRYIRLANFASEVHSQRCEACQAPMRKLISIPALKTETRFFRGHDDNLGEDNRSRTILRQNAAREGISISGGKYFPQLAEKPLDPKAVCFSKSDIRRRLRELGKGSDELGVKVSEKPREKRPYRVADDIVAKEAADIARRQGMKNLSPKEKQKLKDEVRERITPKNMTQTVLA